jgi:excisionase family DNA binding protein
MSDAPTDKRTDFLTAKQLAEALQVSETTIHRLRRSGRIPSVHVTDRLVRYNLRDVRRALQRAHAAEPEPTPGGDDAQMEFADIFSAFEAAAQE